ncbi:MAG: heterodisulfide reductase-related iron-sulfur binding cluster [Acidobacteriota bacterium]
MEPKQTPAGELIGISGRLARRVREELGQNVYLCYQCVKCTSGCPVGEFFDWQPHQIMRALQLGEESIALRSETPWLCASCQTCSTRCPQGLNITAIMEFLTREARSQGIKAEVPEVAVFNQAFMRQVRLWGRAYELGLMGELKLRTGKLMDDMDLATKMLRRHKLAFMPSPTRRRGKIKPQPHPAGAVAYYPGCSLHSTAAEFDASARGVCKALGIALVEPRNWLCCGSTAAHRADPLAALQLPLRNLQIVEQSGFTEVTMPCASCFNRHKTVQHEIRQSPQIRDRLEKANGDRYQDTVQVSSLLQTIQRHTGPEKLAGKVKRPLKGLRVACYYGCLLTRPPEVVQASHHENPTEMDHLLRATGLEVRDWSYKTSCCGGSHSLTRPDIALKLSRELIEQARKAGAEAIAVACPLCHANLDARQFQMKLSERTPVFYFTQLLALALGLPEKATALHKNLTDPRPFLKGKGLM